MADLKEKDISRNPSSLVGTDKLRIVYNDGGTEESGNITVDNAKETLGINDKADKSVYDPSNKNADAFDMDNMDESATKKVFTNTERTKLSGAEEQANKGQANGYASLDGSGLVPVAQLPSSVIGGLKIIGTWNADTNTPNLSSLSLNQGEAYMVSVGGSTNLNGETNWKAKDLAVWDDSLTGDWFKMDNTDDVFSVNGETGAVTLTKTHIGLSNVDNTSDANKPVSTAQQTALNTKVNSSDYDDADVKTKYENNADTNAYTDAEKTKLSNIEDSADVTDATNVASVIHGATSKTTPVDADTISLIDSAASNGLKKLSWANLKATLKTYLDTLYPAIASVLTKTNTTAFTPTADYHPATKKYVDDNAGGGGGTSFVDRGLYPLMFEGEASAKWQWYFNKDSASLYETNICNDIATLVAPTGIVAPDIDVVTNYHPGWIITKDTTITELQAQFAPRHAGATYHLGLVLIRPTYDVNGYETGRVISSLWYDATGITVGASSQKQQTKTFTGLSLVLQKGDLVTPLTMNSTRTTTTMYAVQVTPTKIL